MELNEKIRRPRENNNNSLESVDLFWKVSQLVIDGGGTKVRWME